MDLNPAFNFESYVVGQSNESAAAAARAVAEGPGLVYNPLCIFGPSGQGKTHLLMALAHLARRHTPSLAVRYMTLAEFGEAFETAVAAGQHAAFSRRLSELDMLLLDDVQILAGQDAIQDELCRLQDRMWRAGKQLVITCDRSLEDLTGVDERLIARLGGGLAVDVAPPDAAMRRAILERCADTLEVRFDHGVLDAVAQQPVRSVRDLLSALARLVALDAAASGVVTPTDVPSLFGGAGARAGTAAAEPVGTSLDDGEESGDEFAAFVAAVTLKIAESARQWRLQAHQNTPAMPDKVESREKMISAWPVAEARLIEELL